MIHLPDHPYATKQGYYLYHRHIIEQSIGRILKPSEVVHHRDKNITNNDISNLQILTPSEHTLLHHKKDMSNRSCYECNSKETTIGSDGNPCWFKWKDNSFCCKRCYSKIKMREKRNKNRC